MEKLIHLIGQFSNGMERRNNRMESTGVKFCSAQGGTYLTLNGGMSYKSYVMNLHLSTRTSSITFIFNQYSLSLCVVN